MVALWFSEVILYPNHYDQPIWLILSWDHPGFNPLVHSEYISSANTSGEALGWEYIGWITRKRPEPDTPV